MCSSADLWATQNPKARLIATLACLKSRERIQREPGERQAASRLGDLAAATIAPCSTSAGDQDTDGQTDEFDETARRTCDLAVYGLQILDICNDDYSAMYSDDTILTLVSFTEDTWSEERAQNTPCYHFAPQPYPWATPEASELAGLVLEKQLAQYFTAETLIVKTILQEYLRPLFSKSRPSTVTASGRKAEFRDDDEDYRRGLRDEIEAKPWKFADHRAIAIFRWAVHRANASTLFISHTKPFEPASQIFD